MRSGLIRKDLLPLYAKEYMPQTHVISSYTDVQQVLSSFPLWIVKYADSSNGFGIQILNNEDFDAFQQLFQDEQYVGNEALPKF